MGSAEELVEIRPRELQFLFEVKKQSSCSIHLVNKTDEYVAFKVKTTSPKRYCVRPNIGVILPRATCVFTVTMQAQKTAPPDLQIKDKFLVQTTAIPDGITDEGTIPAFFAKETRRYVEENKLRVVLVSATRPEAEQVISGIPNVKTTIEVPVAKETLNIVNEVPNVVNQVPHSLKASFPVNEIPSPAEYANRSQGSPTVSIQSQFSSTELNRTLKETPAPRDFRVPLKEDPATSAEYAIPLKGTPTVSVQAQCGSTEMKSDISVNTENLHSFRVEDVENMKSELTNLEVKLQQAEILIIKLREEARTSIQERDKLRHE